jgi:tRNA dimethylallyltransferase
LNTQSPSADLVPLVAILGPTAVGKSALAIALARQFSAEIIVCDSTQIYRGFDIGTGKVTTQERCGITHHLMDVADAGQPFSAGEYRRRALAVLADLRERGVLPIFTVGTGLYWRALTEGLSDAPQRCEPLRARLQASAARHEPGYLHRMLRHVDPAAAARISNQDSQKLIRALEICLLTGRPLIELHRSGRAPLEGYAVIKIGLDPTRAELRKRIEQRVHVMIANGWSREVQSLLAAQTPVSAKPFEFIGYRELREHLQQGKPLRETIEQIVHATRRYAKRQLTWFRKEPDVKWHTGFGDDEKTQTTLVHSLRQILQASAPATYRIHGAPVAENTDRGA